MRRILLIITFVFGITAIGAGKMPQKKNIIAGMEKVNGHFMVCHNPAGNSIRSPLSLPSGVRTRSMHSEGQMALHCVSSQSFYPSK